MKCIPCCEKHPKSNSSETKQEAPEGGDDGGDQLGSLRELGPQSSQTGRSTGWPEKPCLTMGSGMQNRGSRFVYIYLHLIYRTGIYRYKWNHSKTAVKPFRPS